MKQPKEEGAKAEKKKKKENDSDPKYPSSAIPGPGGVVAKGVEEKRKQCVHVIRIRDE